MTLDDLLDRLERVKKSGNGYTARCPGPTHSRGDRGPSLSVTEGDDRLLLHCHAGCDQDDVLDALGLSWKDIVYDSKLRDAPPKNKTNNGVSSSGAPLEPEAVYPYTDENGNLLYEVVRFPGKQFRQRRANGDWGLGDTPRALYGLPAVLQGVSEGKTIYVCEGEKDVHALRSKGKVATCNSGGAGKWSSEYAVYLQGANVIVVQDKDEPGAKHAAAVAASLRGVARKVVIVEALDGKDAYDHLVTYGHPVEKFQIQDDAPKTIPIKSVKQFAAEVKPYLDEREYLGPLLYGGQRVHIAGPSGHGKTTLMLEMQSAALRGEEFLSWRGRGGGLRALHIDLEMPDHLLSQAVHDARLGDTNLNLIHLPDGLEIDTNESHRQMIEAAVEGFDIVTIDPFFKLVANEMEYSSIRSVIGLLDRLRKKHPQMVMLVGFHTQEPFNHKQRLNMASIRGFKSWHNPADIVLTFQRTQGNTSRVVWAKDRPGRLGVSIDEEWVLEWTRGYGFQRVIELGDTHVPGVFGT